MARPLSLVISKEPDTPSLDCRSGQGLSSISCAISIPIEAHSHAHCHAERVSPSLARLAKSDWCRHCGSGRMRKLHSFGEPIGQAYPLTHLWRCFREGAGGRSGARPLICVAAVHGARQSRPGCCLSIAFVERKRVVWGKRGSVSLDL